MTQPGYILFFLPVVFDSEVVKNPSVQKRKSEIPVKPLRAFLPNLSKFDQKKGSSALLGKSHKHWVVENNKIPSWIRHDLDT